MTHNWVKGHARRHDFQSHDFLCRRPTLKAAADSFQFSAEIWCSLALIAGGRHERALSRR